MNRWFGPLTVAGFALSTLACSQPAPPEKYPSVDSWAQGMAEAECAGVAGVCGIAETKCQATRKGYWLDWSTKLGANRKYNSSLAEACIGGWRAAHADGKLLPQEVDPTAFSSPIAQCHRTFVGTVKENDPCGSDFECATQTHICDEVGAAMGGAPKVCAARAEKAIDKGCANAGDTCIKGSFCGSKNALPICLARKAKGEACDDKNLCLEDLRCDTTCKERAAQGSDCAADVECQSSAPFCLQAAMGKKCFTQISFAPGATSCTPYGG